MPFIFFGCTPKISYNSLQNTWVGEKYVNYQHYQTIVGDKFMVSSSEELASKIGLDILKKGGNAIDASIAVQLALNVIEPHSSGIGGGLLMIYHHKKTKKNIYFNGRETSPSKAFPEMFFDENHQPRKFQDALQGGLSVGTPGVLKTLYLAHKKYGKLNFSELFDPAINLARNGFVMNQRIYNSLDNLDYLKNFSGMDNFYDDNKKIKKIGSIIYNFELANTLENIAKNGINIFYDGAIAKKIVNAVQNSKINPGLLSLDDLKNYQPKTGKLICIFYRQKFKICSMPFPSGGVATLQSMAILENFNLSDLKPNSPLAIHLIAEANKLTTADKKQYFGDVDHEIISKLLDKKYLKNRAQQIDLKLANTNVQAGQLNIPKKIINNNLEKPSTTHFSIVDKEGNVVALTSSIEYFFGSGLVVEGFALNNQLTDFSLNPYHNHRLVANAIAPNKQPLSSMAPTFVFDKNNNLILALGSPGGPRISQFIVKTLIAYLDWNLDIQQAISLPNFIAINNFLELEDRTILTTLKKSLEQMNHRVVITDITSGINAISLDKNILKGGADPRRNGYVATNLN